MTLPTTFLDSVPRLGAWPGRRGAPAVWSCMDCMGTAPQSLGRELAVEEILSIRHTPGCPNAWRFAFALSDAGCRPDREHPP